MTRMRFKNSRSLLCGLMCLFLLPACSSMHSGESYQEAKAKDGTSEVIEREPITRLGFVPSRESEETFDIVVMDSEDEPKAEDLGKIEAASGENTE